MFQTSTQQSSQHIRSAKPELSARIILLTAGGAVVLFSLLIWSGYIAAWMQMGEAPAETAWMNALIKNLLLLLAALPAVSFALRMLKAAQESQSMFEHLFDESREPILVYALDGRIQACNTACAEMLGYPAQELAQMKFHDLLSLDSETNLKVLKNADPADPQEPLLVMKTNNGEAIIVQSHEQRVRLQRKMQVIAFLENITERYRERQKQEALGSITSRLLNLSNAADGCRTLCAELVRCCDAVVVFLVEIDLAYSRMRILNRDGAPQRLAEVNRLLDRELEMDHAILELSTCQKNWFLQNQLSTFICPHSQFPALLFKESETSPRGMYARQLFDDGNLVTSLLVFDFKGSFDLLFAESVLNFFSTALIRIRTEERLHKNQIQLSETQQLVKVGRFQYDYHSKRSLFSEELCQIFGLPADSSEYEMIKSIHPEDQPKFAELLDSSIENPGPDLLQLNFRVQHPDGRIHYMRSQSKIHFDEHNHAEYLLTAVHDATELIETRSQLQTSQSRYEMVVENSPSLVVVTGLDGRIKFSNWGSRAGKIFEDWLDREVYDLFAASARPGAREAVQQAIDSKTIVSLELPVTGIKTETMTDTGKLRLLKQKQSAPSTPPAESSQTMLVNISPVIIEGEVAEVIFNLADLSDKMRMENNLRSSRHNFELIFEESPAMIAIVSQKDGSILQINKAFGRMFGLSKAEARRKSILDLGLWASAEDRDRSLKTASQPPAEQTITLEQDGSQRSLSLVVHPITLESELCSILFLWDITVQKQIEDSLVQERASLSSQVERQMEELQFANAQLNRALQAKDDFVTSMSYELRAPLTTILGVLEVLYVQHTEPVSPRMRGYLVQIERSSRELLDMINNILDLTRIGKQQEELYMEKIILSEMCRTSLMVVQQQANKKRIQLQYEVAPGLSYSFADPIRLKQILTNLLSNSVKFTPHGGLVGLRVTVSEDGQWMRYCVWDTGVGMEKTRLENAFAPFTKFAPNEPTPGTENEKTAGAGLGLALVSQLTQLHHGRVEVESTPGSGTRITILLPHTTQASPKPYNPDAEEAAMRR